MKLLKKLGYRLDLKLKDSKHEEMDRAEQVSLMRRLLLIPKINEAYRLKSETKDALTIAINAMNEKKLWLTAYNLALKTDAAALPIIESNFRHHYQLKIMVLLYLLTNLITYVAILNDMRNQRNPSLIVDIVIFNVLFCAILTAILPSLFKFIIPALSPSETDEVLHAAFEAGFDFNKLSPGERLSDSTSLICKVINHTENAVVLAKIMRPNIPDELICPITHEIMTDPVYSNQTPYRYERTAILKWLDEHADDPMTRRPLDQDDLIRDFALKRKADFFVATRMSKPIDETASITFDLV